jgi:glycosyltransferase involved in cell wall biosynthesis
VKILFLSSWFPYPPTNGAKIRIYNLIRQLAKHHEIDVVSLARTLTLEQARTHVPFLKQYCRTVEVIAARPFVPGSFAAYKGFVSLKPRSLVQAYSPEMARLVSDKVRSHVYDVVVASEVGPPGLVSLLACRIDGVPKVLDALEVALAKDAYEGQTSPLSRLRHGLTWFKLRRFSKEMLRQADACTVPSEQEKQNLLEIVPQHSHIEVIPHSLDLTYYTGCFGSPKPSSLIFTGSFTYQANMDAARYFLEEIYPRVKTSLPDARIQIVGSTDGADLNTWPVDDSVTFTGFLQDVRPSVAQSWLSVVPLRVGAGTRLKIIESMALGTPVVSTSKGAEGLEVAHGENILIADDPEQFAEAVVETARNPELREKLSEAGLGLVRNRYGSDVMGRNLDSFLDHVVHSEDLMSRVYAYDR